MYLDLKENNIKDLFVYHRDPMHTQIKKGYYYYTSFQSHIRCDQFNYYKKNSIQHKL